MWIRSQNKKILCECKEVYLGDHYDYYQIENDKWVLGEYSTEEKALKVLDKIQSAIIKNETIYAHEFSGSGVRDYDIFQMPQDDEVF